MTWLIFAMWMINFCILVRGFSFNSYSKIQPIHAGGRVEIRKVLFNLLICLLHKYAEMSKNEEDILCPAGKKIFTVSFSYVFLLPDCYLRHHQIHLPQGLLLLRQVTHHYWKGKKTELSLSNILFCCNYLTKNGGNLCFQWEIAPEIGVISYLL